MYSCSKSFRELKSAIKSQFFLYLGGLGAKLSFYSKKNAWGKIFGRLAFYTWVVSPEPFQIFAVLKVSTRVLWQCRAPLSWEAHYSYHREEPRALFFLKLFNRFRKLRAIVWSDLRSLLPSISLSNFCTKYFSSISLNLEQIFSLLLFRLFSLSFEMFQSK